jgi:hypothetical protein
MKLQSLIEELEKQKALKWDNKLRMSELEMGMDGNRPFLRIQGEKTALITHPCHDQIAEKLEIPLKYYRKMEEEAPELLAENVNTWLKKKGKDVFLRCLGDSARALLGGRYRVIDHLDVLYCSLNELRAHEAEIENCFLSETEMNIKVKSQKLKDFVKEKDDLMVGGIFISNSETGHKALRIEPRLFRVKCSNGMILEELVHREIHIGIGDDIEDEMLYLTLRRSIREVFSSFGELIMCLRGSTEILIRNLLNVVQNVVEEYKLSEVQKSNILMAFGAEPEYDQYGIANAVSLAAQKEETWEKSVELERIGGRLITLPPEEFNRLDC